MIPINLIWITTFRTAEFLDCIDIYNNDFFVVLRRDVPCMIGFPIQILDTAIEQLWYEKIQYINKRQIQRGEIFWQDDAKLWTIYILMHNEDAIYAFVRFTPFKTYPTIAWIFKDGTLYNDYMIEYHKPFIPAREAKITMTNRFILNGMYQYVDRKFFQKNRNEILDKDRIPADNLRVLLI